ncbi:YjbH domain-containing protein [Jhaorihella thermophila]|uniref:YjbH domain-containing protein n=1 Tax=Jhaorihella thermophila TaxID=488547 RepID=UPI001F22C901|nr:YjbH domain-containing protein [Jhaorihella thermophila]
MPPSAQNLSTYGTPGLIDMPTAETMPDGQLAGTVSVFENTQRYTTTFQILPRLSGSFRYSIIGGDGSQKTYDRSFDVHYQFLTETARRPAMAIGLRDIMGTGIYSSEYVVATKTVADRLHLTAGMGWGRLGSRGGFTNPLSIFGNGFKTRPGRGATGGSRGGKLTTDAWFRGDAALFAGLRYDVNDRWSVMAEYSSDAYSEESAKYGFTPDIPFNFGVSYRFRNGLTANGYYMYGQSLGFQLSYALNPKHPQAPGGVGPAAPALKPVSQVAAASWNQATEVAQRHENARDVLRAELDREGIRMVGYDVYGDTATVEIENRRYDASAQAVGRTARAMANTLDPSVKTFRVVLTKQGVPVSRITTRRADLYKLEHEVDGSWRSFARAGIADAVVGVRGEPLPHAWPHFAYRFGPYLTFSFFDPDDPLRYEVGAQFRGDYMIRPGLAISTDLRLPLFGTMDKVTRVSNSVLPHVRSDWAKYARESTFRINRLTTDYYWRPGKDLYAKVSAGYLEEMFGGVAGELLWYPQGSKLALGGEIAYARQRDYDMLLGFRDYDVVTGHASIYYDLPAGFRAQVDAGRYLAGDWGATFALDREFNNGFKVGAFFTRTNVSAAEFGEGSFDKGIRFEIPLSWFTREPTRETFGQTIRPLMRDGGARLNLANRLYDYTRDANGTQLANRWGRFFR